MYRERFPMKFLKPFLFILFISFSAGWPRNLTQSENIILPIPDEAQVFEWWDDGLISGEEAEELLGKIQEGASWEACHLVEALALEPCKAQVMPSEKDESAKGETLAAKGYVVYKVRLDSLGKMNKETLDLDVSFYRLNLHLGTRNLLSYRNGGAEAFFGQIAAREFHSQIGTDTLWGTAVHYPVGNFQVQAALDTALNFQAGLGFKRRDFSINGFVWYHPSEKIPEVSADDPLAVSSGGSQVGSVAASQAGSAGLQLKIPNGEIASWWQPGQQAPLTRIHLQKTFRKKDFLQVSWQTTAYFHGTEIPEQANLSATLQKNRFTGTQVIAATFPTSWGDWQWDSKLAATARVFSPLGSDSLKGRFKLSAETGPQKLRGTAYWTCLETSDHCRQNDLQLKISSRNSTDFSFGAAVKGRHTRNEGFAPPQTEGFALYKPTENLSSKISVIIPKGDPGTQTQIRSESFLGNEHFQSTLVVTFRCTPDENCHPIRGIFQLKWLF